MKRGFLAYIVPVSGDAGAHPEHPIVLPPGDEHPAHPIVIPPDAIAPGVPTHPIYIPVYPMHPIVIPPGAIDGTHPEHPIVLPPVISGPPGPWPTPPIFIPPGSISDGVPTHPIYLPPVIWPDPDRPHPEHPIYFPDPDDPGIIKPPTEGQSGWGYTVRYGWVWVPEGSGGKPKPPGDPDRPTVQPVGSSGRHK